MNNKKLNIAILEELKQIATEIFANEIDISPGTYTAAELAKLKDTKGVDIIINYIESILTRSVCVENFKCEFERKKLYASNVNRKTYPIIGTFSIACPIPTKQRPHQ